MLLERDSSAGGLHVCRMRHDTAAAIVCCRHWPSHQGASEEGRWWRRELGQVGLICCVVAHAADCIFGVSP
jgi:hypothetical protein